MLIFSFGTGVYFLACFSETSGIGTVKKARIYNNGSVKTANMGSN